MNEEIPYAAKYVIGFLVFLAIISMFDGLLAIVYPDFFTDTAEDSVYINVIYTLLSVLLSVLALLLWLGMPLAQKVCTILMLFNIATDIASIMISLSMVDIMNIGVSLVVVALLLSKPVRTYYAGWDAGFLKGADVLKEYV